MNVVLRVHKVFKASLDHLDHQDPMAPKDSVVCLDRREDKVTLELLVNLASKVLRVWLVSWELRDNVVTLATVDSLVLWDLLDDLEQLVPLETLEMLVCLDLEELLVSKDPLVIKEDLVSPALLDSLVPQELKDLKERVALRVALDLLDSLDPQVLQEIVDFLVFLAHQVLLVNVVLWALLVNLVWKENVVQKVLQAPLVLLDPLDLLDLKETAVCLELMENVVPLVFLVVLVTKDPQDPLAQLAAPDLLDFPAHQALLVQLDLQEKEVTEVRWDPKVWKALLDHEANLVHPEHKERKETLVNLDLKELKDIVVSWVYKVSLVHRVPEVTKVFLVCLVPLVLVVNLVLRVPQVAMEVLVYKVSWVPQVLVVPLVRKVDLVHLVPQDLLVHLDLLASLWATMLRRWLPFLVKASPRAPTHYKEMTRKYPLDSSERRLLTTNAETLSPRLMNSLRLHSRSSLNLKEPRTHLPKLARTCHMLIQNIQVVSTGLIPMRVAFKMLF